MDDADRELAAARTAFIEAAEYESSEKWAQQWLRFVDVEQERLAAFTLSPGGS